MRFFKLLQNIPFNAIVNGASLCRQRVSDMIQPLDSGVLWGRLGAT